MPARMGNAIASPRYRNRVQPPSMIIEALNLKPGMTVLEVGCGSGFYTVEVAKAIQPDGVVYAVDIQEGMLEKLRDRMERENVQNITPILADAEGTIPLDDGIVDAAFSVAVIPEIPDPVQALTHPLVKYLCLFVYLQTNQVAYCLLHQSKLVNFYHNVLLLYH